ncbi:MAG: hypothetical protein HYY37_06395 [Candidatus Aenigmarchaeota archaeon]|nr:hypothetical protein [Candidatus Aenigmarchaeota archaeon]
MVCVPLSNDHPFEKHGVFAFWEANGYTIAGAVDWVPRPNERIVCHVYKKTL